MSANILIATLVGIVMAPMLIWVTRDLESKPASRFWIAGWSLMWLSSVTALFAGDTPLFGVLATTAWFAGAGCHLAGARAFVHRPNLRALALAVATLGASVVAAQFFTAGRTAALIVSAGSAPVLAAGAWLVFRHGQRPDAGKAERLLGAALLGMAAFAAVDWIFPRVPSLYGAWGFTAMAVSLLQALAIAERDRVRAQNLAEERDVLHGIALALGEADFGQRFVDALRPTRYHELFRGFGVWVRSENGNKIEHIAGKIGDGAALPASLKESSLDRPIVRAAVESEGPLFLEDMGRDPRIIESVRRTGASSGFIAPLRVNGEVVGTIGGMLSPGYALDADTRRFVADLADQIALVVAATRLRDGQARQAARLDAEQRVLRAMTEAVPTGIMMSDPQGRIVLMNEHICEMFGFGSPDAWTGRNARELLGAMDARPVDPAEMDAFILRHAEARLRPVEGRTLEFEDGRTIEVAARPVRSETDEHIGRVWAIRDVTEERALGERLQQADRMQTLGTLAGGLAHDFNNQLTAILGNTALLSRTLSGRPEELAPLRDIEHAAEHCADLTQGLLAFARQGPIETRAVSVSAAIEGVRSLLATAMPPDVVLEVAVSPDTKAVLADETQLHRVLTNLVVNAVDAVGVRGTIRVEARPSDADAGHIQLVVADDGCGMSETVLRRIFDPFFTTKGAQRGTGLGLAVVYGIVESHGGSIDVESEPGRGTRFAILWPAADACTAPSVATPERRVPEVTGTILLAEDEPAVRRLVSSALQGAGFRVVEASDGNAATAAAEKYEIDAALLDLTMPGPDGLDTLARIRTRHPGLPGLIMTGRPERPNGADWPPGVPVLLKPFSPAQVVARVCDLVAASR